MIEIKHVIEDGAEFSGRVGQERYSWKILARVMELMVKLRRKKKKLEEVEYVGHSRANACG